MLLTLLLSLAQAGVTCTSTSGPHTIRYSTYAKSGGAHPGPKTTMFSDSWSIDDEEVFASARAYDGSETRSPDVDWAWDQDKTTDGRIVQDSHTTYEVRYRTEVRLFRPSGKALVPGLTEWNGKMTCTRVDLRGVP